MRIKIISDSTCDLSPALLQEHDITLAHLTVVKNEQNFLDGVTITPEDIFAHVAAGGALCTTSALSIGEYQELFAEFSPKYDAVIHINISAEFSSCYQNACIAAQGFPNVRVIDSRNLSTGQGHIVLEACRLAKTCEDLDEICEKLQDLTGRVEASFVLNRLEYMVKGGRCSSATALGANLLSLKPCIEVKDGKMQVVKKYRGNYTKCLQHYVQDRLENRDDIETDRLFITYTPVSDEALSAVRHTVAQCNNGFSNIYETTAGCTVSCHCGPGTLGVLFIRSK